VNIQKPDHITPYPWQEEVAQLVQTGRRALACAAPPGAGKTIAGLLAIEAAAKAGAAHAASLGKEPTGSSSLIVAPAGKVAAQWVAEARGWGCEAVLLGGPGRGERKLAAQVLESLGPAAAGSHMVLVLPWSRCQRKADAKALLNVLDRLAFALSDNQAVFGVLLVDESHYAQGAEDTVGGCTTLGYASKRGHKQIKGLRHYAARVLALTGTPVTSRPPLVRAQLLFARLDQIAEDRHGLMPDRFAYERRWWGGRQAFNYAARRNIWVTEETPAAGHLALVNEAIYRVDPAQLRAQLPAHRRVMLTGFEEGAVPSELKEWADAKEAGEELALPSLEDLAEMRREATAERARGIAELAEAWGREAPEGQMLIVWCAYRESVGHITDALLHIEGPVNALHGGMTDAHRASVLASAIAGGVRVLVATHASTGTGVDGLQDTCCQQIVAEAPWTPGTAEQMEGRIARTGQAQPVLSRWIANGIEGQILRGIGLKAEAIDNVLIGGATDAWMEAFFNG